LPGKGDRIEAFVHVEDLCRAVLYAFDNDAMIGEIYNISDDSRVTTAEFFTLVCRELLGEEKPFLRVPMRLLLPLAAVSQFLAKLMKKKSLLEKQTLQYLSCDRIWDSTKLKEAGFRFTYPTFEAGMKETLHWYHDHGWLRG
jgi:nucleoside-diphosphate-sugar epimerase